MQKDAKNLVLLVLGNGFDLQCGLKSRYRDFLNWKNTNCSGFKYLINMYKENKYLFKHSDEEIEYLIKSKEISIWDIYFVFDDNAIIDGDWFDVEAAIRKSLINGSWNQIYDVLSATLSNWFPRKLTNSDPKECANRLKEIYVYFIRKRYCENGTWYGPLAQSNIPENDEENFYLSLLTELEIFEDGFSNYIQSQTDATTENGRKYYSKQEENIEILKNDMIKSESLENDNVDFKIATFNYSNIQKYGNETTYLHGSINTKTIFGIDATDEKVATNKKMFTKQERLQYANIENDLEWIIGYSYIVVGFYGVSFNEQDYSEYANLLQPNYNGYIPKIFLYTPKDKNLEECTIIKFKKFFDKEIGNKNQPQTTYSEQKKKSWIKPKQIDMA